MLTIIALISCQRVSDSDSDSDGLFDSVELLIGTSSTMEDSDQDGLDDAAEHLCHHSDPTNPDTDEDGALDAWEIDRGLNPLDPESRPYRTGADMLTLQQKLALEASEPVSIVEIEMPVHRAILFDEFEDKFDLYDLALTTKYTLIHVPSTGAYLDQWLAEGVGSPPGGLPDWLKNMILDESIQTVELCSIQADSGRPCGPTYGKENERTFPTLSFIHHLADPYRVYWAFFDFPELDTHFYLLDNKMIVRAIDDFDEMKRLIDAGPPP